MTYANTENETPDFYYVNIVSGGSNPDKESKIFGTLEEAKRSARRIADKNKNVYVVCGDSEGEEYSF